MYHLNLLKGGYLAVCGFFALSGYLTCLSIVTNKDFKLGSFYLKRLVKLYLPMLFVVFVSIGLIILIGDITWVSLKPETTSVLLGYNNFWQIGANMDYFARHMDSPFMHLWYISILLQLTLAAPLFVLLLRKPAKTKGWNFSARVSFGVSAALCILFIWFSCMQEIMLVYYHTLSRAFSFFLGISAAFLSVLFRDKTLRVSRVLFIILIAVLLVMFVFVPSDSPFFAAAMIISTVVSCISLICANLIKQKPADPQKQSIIAKLTVYISDMSYEIYLVQYPLIFIMQYLAPDAGRVFVCSAVIVLTVLASIGMHLCFTKYKKKRVRVCICILAVLCAFGCYQYIIAKDHTEEMAQLEAQLAKNQELMQIRQADYEKRMKEEQNEWEQKLIGLDFSEEDISKMVSDMPITAVGDSVMLGASSKLYEDFPNLYCDAAQSRTGWVLPGILKDLADKGMLADTIVIGVGTNGDCPNSVKEQIMEICSGAEVYWMNVTNDNDVHVNARVKEFLKGYGNAHLVDWVSASKGHPEYFVADGIHLTKDGREAYSKTIHAAICSTYKKKYENERAAVIAAHEDAANRKISFWGNDLLLNLYDDIHTDLDICGMHLYSEENKDDWIADFEAAAKNNELTHRLVFAFTDDAFDADEFNRILEMCADRFVYIVETKTSDSMVKFFERDNVSLIDFSKELNEHKEYLYADGIHLSPAGNSALGALISSIINK